MVRKPMVAWLSPSVLARSASEVVLSKLFADFADKREIEGGLGDDWFDCRAEGPGTFWLDYASDVGDGFDTTYAIARLLAREELTVEGEVTRRGRVLVLGGDQVYPSASWPAYHERFKGPYEAALPAVPEDERPRLFAIPGNHDWYDGLTSFMRFFCQGAGIGGWQTRQKRSYFALALPHGWWLWGIDIQFDAYIDAPQLAYFTHVAERIRDGDRIVLATAKPSWVRVEPGEPPPQSWQTLAYLRERVIPARATLALTVTGDLHHYSRYQPELDLDPKVTAGGGGAYLSATHWLPAWRELPPLKGGAPARYTRAVCWPSVQESRDLRAGVLGHLLPWRTPGLNGLLAGIYALVTLLLALGIRDQDDSLAPSLRRSDGLELARDALMLGALVLAVLLAWGLAAWARSAEAPRRAGVAHALVHLAAVTALALVAFELDPFGLAGDGFWLGYASAALVGVAGALVGRAILTLYLFLAQLPGGRAHNREVFAAQSRQAGTGFKHFLRLRIDAGGLTMYAIGLRAVPRQWTDGDRPEPVGGWPAVELVDRVDL